MLSARGWLSIPMQRSRWVDMHMFQVAILESIEVLGEKLRGMFMIVKWGKLAYVRYKKKICKEKDW